MIFIPKFAAKSQGALAQLARVSDWQSEGHGFDSRTLHTKAGQDYQYFVPFLLLFRK